MLYKSENEKTYKNNIIDIDNISNNAKIYPESKEENQKRCFILNKYETNYNFNTDYNNIINDNNDKLQNYIDCDLNSEIKDNNNNNFFENNNYFPGFSFSTLDEDEDEFKFSI